MRHNYTAIQLRHAWGCGLWLGLGLGLVAVNHIHIMEYLDRQNRLLPLSHRKSKATFLGAAEMVLLVSGGVLIPSLLS